MAEPAIVESARQRSLRVPLDHFRRGDPLIRWKWRLSLAAVALAVGYVGWLLIDARAGRRHASPGSLASAHASWNDDCQSCHLNFRPLSSGSADLLSAFRPPGTQHLVDQACTRCHAAQSQPHQGNLISDEAATCAACHAEHRGLAADLKRPGDAHCTSCHAQIAAHRTAPISAAEPIADVSRFASQAHPDFRSLDSDPGNVKFNHWLHLQPGVAASDARQNLKLADLDAAGQQQYQRFSAGDLVQLDCAACHEPDSSGASMQPIAFERHCRACHRLEVKFAEAAERVPHGLSAERLTQALDGLLLAPRLQPSPAAATPDESGAEPLIPGRTLGKNLAQKIGDDLARQRKLAATQVNLQCALCHRPAAAAPPIQLLADWLPPAIPAQWLVHATFDHSAHRHVECRTCHADAFGRADQPDDERVMIAGQATCIQCHAPRAHGAGGARHDCAECHRYHALHRKSSSFPGSTLGTHFPEASASLAVTQASFAAPAVLGIAANSQAAHSHPVLDRLTTCATANCHGDARPAAPAWRSAFATWLARDPHAQAYEVLWTFRAREMTRLIASRPPAHAEPLPLGDAEHTQALQQRCLSCHATSSGEGQALGVHCESCHGNADSWLSAHTRQGFSRTTEGFLDTKHLGIRSAACMSCHVGPNTSGGRPQAVDHDLIAAGHPRLSFEFRAYSESLPAHWDRRADDQRNLPAPHFRAWLAGQQAQLAQQRLAGYLENESGPLGDFALLDCASCHHQLANEPRDFASRGLPGRSLWPRRELQSLAATDVIPRRPQIVQALLQESADASRGSYDSAVQSYLAARAIAADAAPGQTDVQLDPALVALGRYLGRDCFGPGKRSAYDWPRQFDRRELAPHVQAVLSALSGVAGREAETP